MKTNPVFKSISNWWMYYFLKWGIFRKAELSINTFPDPLRLFLTPKLLKEHKGDLHFLFKHMSQKNFLYDSESNKMTVYSEDISSRQDEFSLGLLQRLHLLMEDHILFSETRDADFWLCEYEGMKCYVRKNTLADIWVIKETWARKEYEFLRPHIKDSIVLDLGANIGDTAILFAKWGAKRIYSYEPHPFFYALASQNISLNNMGDKMFLFNAGVGAKNVMLEIHENRHLGACASFGLDETDDGATIPITIKSCHDVLGEIGRVDVLKMDCEGAEYEIIEALSHDEFLKIKLICFEYHHGLKGIPSKLKSEGFRMREILKKNDKVGLALASRDIGISA